MRKVEELIEVEALLQASGGVQRICNLEQYSFKGLSQHPIIQDCWTRFLATSDR
jgi:hypothetical protein